MQAGENVKKYGKENNLIELIKNEPAFAAVKDKIDGVLNPRNYVGRAPEQVEEFIFGEVEPLLVANKAILGEKGDISL